ncbi:MAG: GNAT family N-acetyltransferase [Coriobacteriales bacterium]|nr:GNAT family N-acetyltransferase [Coriobacteriales bacterium]
MHIERVAQGDKAKLRDLLLLADEQWSCVERYLSRAEIYALLDDAGTAVAELALTDEGNNVAEVQNLAVNPDYQHQGLGRRLLAYALRRCRGRFARLRVRTGDSPLTVPFYETCGFAQVGREEGAILERYDHPIFEAGKQLVDVVVFEQDVPTFRPATRVFTSDLHIGDKAIARWRGFGDDVAAHDELVLTKLEENLRYDDELWILGDICHPRVRDVQQLRAAIPCDNVNVIVGNHDSKSKFITAGGFNTVEYYAHVGKIRREGYRFVLSHYPMLDWDRAFHGTYMLHGHIHSLAATDDGSRSRQGTMGMRGYNERMREQGIRRYDVGVDANGMAPVTAEQIVAALPSDSEWSKLHGLRVD